MTSFNTRARSSAGAPFKPKSFWTVAGIELSSHWLVGCGFCCVGASCTRTPFSIQGLMAMVGMRIPSLAAVGAHGVCGGALAAWAWAWAVSWPAAWAGVGHHGWCQRAQQGVGMRRAPWCQRAQQGAARHGTARCQLHLVVRPAPHASRHSSQSTPNHKGFGVALFFAQARCFCCHATL